MSVSTISHAEQFLVAFNQIEGLVRKLHRSDGAWESFASIIVSLKRKHRIINSYADELRDFADLRNAIVHSRKKDSFIAYPAEETVKRIEWIAGELVRPPRVSTLFLKKVFTVQASSTLFEVLKVMKDNNISQVPIVTGSHVEGDTKR